MSPHDAFEAGVEAKQNGAPRAVPRSVVATLTGRYDFLAADAWYGGWDFGTVRP